MQHGRWAVLRSGSSSLTAKLLLVVLTLWKGCPLASCEAAATTTVVSYAYFEKDEGQKNNFDFFITVGMGIGTDKWSAPRNTEFVIVINGDKCTPCQRLESYARVHRTTDLDGVGEIRTGGGVTMIWRTHNEGMDIAAHNTTLEFLTANSAARRPKHYIFLNSSVRGPFYPLYMPKGWQWTDAFARFLDDEVKAVGASLVCLPDVDAGGPGPRLESWAFAVDRVGLEVLVQAGTFYVRTCKLCTGDDGVVVNGEYGITIALFAKNYKVATLLSKYGPETNWRDEANWQCNNNVHPSRHGTYDGIDMHPYETMFVKASWNVGEPFTSRYTSWYKARAAGNATAGNFDAATYNYAVTEEAQLPPDMSMCYNVPPPHHQGPVSPVGGVQRRALRSRHRRQHGQGQTTMSLP